jgi:hypothetical protein
MRVERVPGNYILENTHPTPLLGGGGEKNYQPMSFRGENMKRGREKGGK